MATQAKQYGRKRGNDLANAFAELTITPKGDKKTTTPSPTPTELANIRRELRPRLEAIRDQSRPPYDENREITTLLRVKCCRPQPFVFTEFYGRYEGKIDVTKVAEGSFAHIYRIALRGEIGTYTIWKLMPLKPAKGRGSRHPNQTSIPDAAEELRALGRMQELRGFVDFRSAQVLQGNLPKQLREVNKEWAEAHGENPNELQSRWPSDQYWLFIEMSDAGTDLETILKDGFPDGTFLNKHKRGSRLTIEQAWDIFWGTTEALARGEVMANFEHRDLHPGNVCVTKTSSKNAPADDDSDETNRYTNLRVTLIDYTLSRATLDDDYVLANSMRDPALFTGTSTDATENRQYHFYRVMRDMVVGNARRSQEVASKWKEFVPTTNVLWLYHILRLLLDETEHYEGKKLEEFRDKTGHELACKLTNILNHIRITNNDEWKYLSAREILDHEMGRLRQGEFDAIVEGDSEPMRPLRAKRSVDSIGSAEVPEDVS